MGGDELIEVNDLSEVPSFASEAEEAEFWSTHSFGPGLLENAVSVPLEGDNYLPPARPRTRPISVRFDEHTLDRLKALAAHRHRGYQSLLREFVAERLYEEELRDGLVQRASER